MFNDSAGKFKKLKGRAAAFCKKLKEWGTAGIKMLEDFLNEIGLERADHKGSNIHDFAHFWLLVIKSFIRNRCLVRASALAYTTLLALIPLLAIVVGISTSLLKSQGDKPVADILEKLVSNVAPQLNLVSKTNAPQTQAVESMPSGRREVVQKISEYIGNIRSGTLGVTGVISLVLVAIFLLSNIEATFNDIWGVEIGRSWFSRVVYYWAAISLGPLCLVVVLALNSGSYVEKTRHLLELTPYLGQWIFWSLPFVLLTITFSLFYALMPNTRVRWRSAFVGGLVGGTLWQLNNIFSVIYISSVVGYSQIYGSLGLVPVFLVGMYFSWVILLFGAQVSYAFQNRHAYIQEKQAESVNHQSRELLAICLMALAGARFRQHEEPPNATDLSNTLAVSHRLVMQILQGLVKARLLVEVAGADTGYVPARPLGQISCKDIVQALRTGLGQSLAPQPSAATDAVLEDWRRIQAAENEASQAVSLENLIQRFQAA